MLRLDRAVPGAALAIVVLAGCPGRSPAPGATETETAASPPPSAPEARLARGEYLVNHVGICFYCHSDIDWKSPGFPQVAGSRGGGAVFPEEGLPGRVVSRNVTPHALGDCTDEQIARGIREGQGCDGTRLFPVMPYQFFRTLSDDDVAAIVAYLRTLAPVENELASTRIPEPVWASLPVPPPITEPVPAPDRTDEAAYGSYLATVGLCVECHTPIDRGGAPLPGLTFAGGRVFTGPWGKVASANLTPDASGIPYYDEALFRDVLRTCRVGARELNRLMPCEYYEGLTDEDISALFAFLRTVAPVAHNVSNVNDPTPCPRCGVPHGLGELNEASAPQP